MKKVLALLYMVVIILLSINNIFSQWSCPSNCQCVENRVPVTCFGAIPSDSLGDSTAIQNAISSVPDNWTVYFPTGIYIIDQPLEINRSNISLLGDGVASELLIPQGTNYPLLSLPRANFTTGCPHNIPRNIVIEKLAFNGNVNRGTVKCPITDHTCSKVFGIFVWQGENIAFKDLLIKQFGLEGITISNGASIPKNISIWRIRAQKMRRTSLHIGYGENISIEDSLIEDANSNIWDPVPGGGPAIDIETEGLDLTCPSTYRDPYIYNVNVINTLIKSPTSEPSRGGISIAPAYGPVRKINLKSNVMINSGGIVSHGNDGVSAPFGADPRIGQSLRNRDLDISGNWISNLHANQPPWDISTIAVNLVRSGEVSDSYGVNDIKLNDNVVTVYINSGNNRLLQFSGIKELNGNNNKTFRPYFDNSGGNPVNSHNFLWSKDFSSADNVNLQILNTLDNGWIGSRLACHDPLTKPQWTYCNLTGTGNSLTWLTNGNPTPTASPIITRVSIHNRVYIWISVSEPNNQPVRVMVLHNGLPLGLKTMQGGGYVRLAKKAVSGDTFSVEAFNENGQSGEHSFTY